MDTWQHEVFLRRHVTDDEVMIVRDTRNLSVTGPAKWVNKVLVMAMRQLLRLLGRLPYFNIPLVISRGHFVWGRITRKAIDRVLAGHNLTSLFKGLHGMNMNFACLLTDPDLTCNLRKRQTACIVGNSKLAFFCHCICIEHFNLFPMIKDPHIFIIGIHSNNFTAFELRRGFDYTISLNLMDEACVGTKVYAVFISCRGMHRLISGHTFNSGWTSSGLTRV